MERVRKNWHPLWLNYAEIQKVLYIPPAPRAFTKHVVLLLGGFTGTNVLNRKVWKLDLTNGKCKEMGKIAHFATKYKPVYCSTSIGLFVIGGSRAIREFVPTDDCSLLTVPAMQWETVA